jgi:hypothetical protein
MSMENILSNSIARREFLKVAGKAALALGAGAQKDFKDSYWITAK